MSAVFSACAKLNLSLDVTGLRPDGYHEMRMVMQSVSLCDDVELSLRADGQITVLSGLRYVPNDERNIAVKAAKLFFESRGITDTGADIVLRKRIPVCAGLAGGSADGAAVLRGLAEITGEKISEDELEALGGQLGSDVPFCVRGGTVLAEGRGEILSDLPALPDCHIVICKPEFSISTPFLFRELDKHELRCHPDTAGIIGLLGNGDLARLSRRMYNVFEDVLPRRCGEVAQIKGALLDNGALGSIMSGTGSAVFGIFDSENAAKRAHDALSGSYRECFLARPTPSNIT
jgi:4-diphosphocytidyl-2-C-methyl-D-erythritol kinase